MKMILCSALALIEDNKVLMTTRPSGKEWNGLWEFPGGKLEDGESPEDALVREIKEELDIEIKKEDLKPFRFASLDFKDSDKHITMFLFLCHRHNGKIRPTEHQKYEFKSKSDLNEVKVPPLDMGLLEEIKTVLE